MKKTGQKHPRYLNAFHREQVERAMKAQSESTPLGLQAALESIRAAMRNSRLAASQSASIKRTTPSGSSSEQPNEPQED